MAKIIWTQRALSDLEDIGNYISKSSEKYASQTLNRILNSALIIEKNSLLGKRVPEFKNPAVRQIISRNYRIIYQIRESDFIYILTVFHVARHLTKKLIK